MGGRYRASLQGPASNALPGGMACSTLAVERVLTNGLLQQGDWGLAFGSRLVYLPIRSLLHPHGLSPELNHALPDNGAEHTQADGWSLPLSVHTLRSIPAELIWTDMGSAGKVRLDGSMHSMSEHESIPHSNVGERSHRKEWRCLEFGFHCVSCL